MSHNSIIIARALNVSIADDIKLVWPNDLFPDF